MTPGEDRRAVRQRGAKILALGLVWGIGVLALLVERGSIHRVQDGASRPVPARTAGRLR
jgi:hypothetical protein